MLVAYKSRRLRANVQSSVLKGQFLSAWATMTWGAPLQMRSYPSSQEATTRGSPMTSASSGAFLMALRIESTTMPARRRTSAGSSTTAQCHGCWFLADGAEQATSRSFSRTVRGTLFSLKARIDRLPHKNCSACSGVTPNSCLTCLHSSGPNQSSLMAPVGHTATQ